MQSSVMSSTFSSSCCCGSKSTKGAVRSRSSLVGPADGCATFCILDVRHQRKLAGKTINLKAAKSEKSWRRSGGNLVIVRAERAPAGSASGGSLDEKLDELNSEEAVEGMQGFDRTARFMVDDLKPVEHPGTTLPKELELEAEGKAFEADESMGGKEPILEVASDSAVDPDHAHEHTVATSEELAPELGRSVEDLTTALEDRAEKASERDAELLSTDKGSAEGEWERGVGQVVDVSKESGGTGEQDRGAEGRVKGVDPEREEANKKILEVAREGYEVLRWAVEGAISAGANSREGLVAAKEIINKRVKSFQEAAEETKEVSSQLSEVARKKYEEIQGSTAKFGEELNVQIEDKKAADDLKPESERNLLSQLSEGVQATVQAATKEDSPLAKLGQNLQEAVSNLGKPTGTDQSEKSDSEDTDRLVPVGEKEGFFQDLAPANGKSPEAGDRSTEASDILGQGDVNDETPSPSEGKQEFEGFFGDIPVSRSPSTTPTAGKQEFEGFFGDIPVDRSPSTTSTADTSKVSSSKLEADVSSAATTEQQRSEVSGDAYETVRQDYEDEVGNDQLKEGEKASSQETPGYFDASREHDPARPTPSAQGKDDMGIGPDE
ncbi:hypothetical protein R1flu_007521 [Riccia fluitans]|uniref:Uncharacterized protein n=1 Tax=Riccia fluitans TaxID=41844 RepID=A0ABD1Z254_9MARC